MRVFLVLMLWAANWVFAAATGTMVLAALVWLIAVIAALASGHGGRTAGLTAAYSAAALQISFSVLILAPASFVAIAVLGLGSPPVAAQIIGALSTDLYMYIGAQSLCAICMGLAVGGVTWRRLAKAMRLSAGPYPRLIVAAPVLVVLLLVQVPFFVFDVLSDFGVCDWEVPYPTAVGVTAVVLYFLLLGAFLVLPYLPGKDNPLHIVMDVVNHFLIRREGLWRRPVRGEGDLTNYAIRNEIHHRFVAVLDLLLRDGPTDLLVIAHSQGTVIAIEGLQAWGGKPAGLERAYLATMGSPFTHIYQFYFPLHYPSPSAEEPHPLEAKLNGWTNVYRIDDYVGTEIAGDGVWPKNHIVTKDGQIEPGRLGAHTTYWVKEVFDIIKDLLPGSPPKEAPAAAPPPPGVLS